MSLARTSKAPLKIYGNPSTLFTWLGKSERPVAMIASGLAFLAISGIISGSGFAKAKIIGFGAIFSTIEASTIPPFESPRNTSASTIAVARSPSEISFTNGALYSFNSPDSKRFLVIIPLESHMMMFFC